MFTFYSWLLDEVDDDDDDDDIVLLFIYVAHGFLRMNEFDSITVPYIAPIQNSV